MGRRVFILNEGSFLEHSSSPGGAARTRPRRTAKLVEYRAIQTPVLDGFEEVRSRDLLHGGEVGDRARDFENPIVGAGRETELLHRLLQEIAQRRIDRAMPANLGVGHPRIRGYPRTGETCELTITGRLHAGSKQRGRLAGFFRTELGERKGRRLDMQIDPVEQRAADPGAVALNLCRAAAALVFRVAEVAAGTGVCCPKVRLS